MSSYVILIMSNLKILNLVNSSFNGHDDKKWEIVIGCMEGIASTIRPGNQLENLSHRSDPR